MKKLIITLVLINIITSAQSLTGLSGLVTIPNTEMMTDGEVRVGAAFLPKEHVSLYSENYDGLATYASFGFLPFIEVGLRFTRLLNYNKGDQALGDRMPSIRLRLLNESNYLPGVVAGLHDFLRTSESQTIYNAASYIVLSKTLINQNSVNLSLVTGYDFNLIKGGSNQFNGFFGGSKITFFENYSLLVEYDSRVWNGGIRLNLFGHISTTLALIKMKYPSGNINLSITI
jgi:hypothetical protein